MRFSGILSEVTQLIFSEIPVRGPFETSQQVFFFCDFSSIFFLNSPEIHFSFFRKCLLTFLKKVFLRLRKILLGFSLFFQKFLTEFSKYFFRKFSKISLLMFFKKFLLAFLHEVFFRHFPCIFFWNSSLRSICRSWYSSIRSSSRLNPKILSEIPEETSGETQK